MLLPEPLVEGRERLALGLGVLGAGALGHDQVVVSPPDVHEGPHLRLAPGGLLRVLQHVVHALGERDQPVALHHHQLVALEDDRVLALLRVGRDDGAAGLPLDGHERPFRDPALQLPQPLHQVLGPGDAHARAADGGAVGPDELAEDVGEVPGPIFVDPDRLALRRLELDRLDEPGSHRLDVRRLALAEDQDVGDDLRAGVFLECAGGQAERRHELGLAREFEARGAAGLVHGPVRGDAHHEAARARLVQRLEEEVVVQRGPERVIAPVRRPHLGEGPVPDHEVVEAVRCLVVLVGLVPDVGLRIEHRRHGGGRLFELDARQFGGFREVRRHQAEEVADAHGGFEHAPAREAHGLDHRPHRLHGRRVGVVGVDDGPLRGLPRLLAEVLAQPLVLVLPPALRVRALPRALEDGLTEHAPPGPAGESLEFLRGRVAPLGRD